MTKRVPDDTRPDVTPPDENDANWSRRQFLTVTAAAATAVAAELAAQPKKKTRRTGPPPHERARYDIWPLVGVARLGNSSDSFYIEPASIGGLPIECDAHGNEKPELVRKFKKDGRIRRQAARFRVMVYDKADPNDPGTEITLDDANVESIEWSAHLANKKAAWYLNTGLVGNVALGNAEDLNYYAKGGFVNVGEEGQNLIIDPGPRSVSKPRQSVEFSRHNIPSDYPKGSFPDKKIKRVPYQIDTLGELKMDDKGRLLILGGFGRCGGQEPIATYTSAPTWFDDTSDGPVYCRLKLKNRAEPIELKAWVIVGSPKVAPELRNISTLADLMFDVGVRDMDLIPAMYRNGAYQPDFKASYDRDVLPILERIADYIWVANVPSMVAFISPRFNPRDASEANRRNRETFFSYFRDSSGNELSPAHERLFHNNIPMVPLNSGSNSVVNPKPDKFMGVTNTQYFLLGQWAKGKFVAEDDGSVPAWANPLNHPSTGNCVGHPMSPGIEVTWTTRNPAIYESPYRIKHARGEAHYREHGLSVLGDETGPWYAKNGFTAPDFVVAQDGCEPGDLTKRMSVPWMADFYQCSVEYINFTDKPNTTAITEIPTPPTYYAYWWPPQAPMFVITGPMTAEEQNDAGLPAGYSAYFTRGANNIGNLTVAWKYMGFIVNTNESPEGRQYPYFVEKERNHDKFVASVVSVAHPINQMSATGSYGTPTNYFTPAWYLKEEGEIAECDGVPDCKNPE